MTNGPTGAVSSLLVFLQVFSRPGYPCTLTAASRVIHMGTLITGGTGFVGAEVVRTLIRRGAASLTVFDINDSPQRLSEIAARVTIRKGDLGNFSQVLDAVRASRADVIYHLGGMLSLPSDLDPQAAFQANALGTYHVLEAARIFGVSKVIFSSTIGTYCLGLEQQPIDDLTLQRPMLFYGACKVFGEHMGAFYRRKYDIDFRCVRFPSIVGPGVRTHGSVQYTSRVIEESANGNPFTIWVRPDTRVTLLYVKDAALAMVALAEVPADRIRMVNYVLGGPRPSAQELADLVAAKLPGAQIDFDVDEDIQNRLDKSSHPIDDRFAATSGVGSRRTISKRWLMIFLRSYRGIRKGTTDGSEPNRSSSSVHRSLVAGLVENHFAGRDDQLSVWRAARGADYVPTGRENGRLFDAPSTNALRCG